ncbi:hypothetical protein [Paenirhodobacter hankyongi]|uniref:Hydrogenase expression/formation protein HupK n=1 Tax=Paenirhodobacter hankyongi TaxID=2294033 RepID=A0A421BPV0_9RHOB|nr:hypothetical protein [Sinirhodobacter hankyongi]RLL65104.1 hypothetical protein DYS74_09785 [Sinirhodobacter hankyongi]
MSTALAITLRPAGAALAVQIVPPAPLPVAALMRGRPAEEVAQLLPRLFNLCGAAQGLAARLALGLPADAADTRREILRDHLAKLCLSGPRLLGLDPRPLPAGWAEGGAGLSVALWGGDKPADLAGWLASGRGMAPLLAEIAARFAPGEATADLPPLTEPMALTAQENSPAGRVAEDPLMRAAEAAFGRGPLWRALGRLVDLDAFCAAPRPARVTEDGTALVAAARGTYALRAETEAGRVTALSRVTPTDHLLAPGGALERALATLPAAKAGLAALVVDLLDPCVAVDLQELSDA